jgi:hypothetical protein
MLNPCRKTLTTRIPLTWNSPDQPLKERKVNMPLTITMSMNTAHVGISLRTSLASPFQAEGIASQFYSCRFGRLSNQRCQWSSRFIGMDPDLLDGEIFGTVQNL